MARLRLGEVRTSKSLARRTYALSHHLGEYLARTGDLVHRRRSQFGNW